jgi:hypothetical protein
MQISRSAETTRTRLWRERARALRLTRFGPWIIATFAIIVMIPRLREPYFGLMDDGTILNIADRILAGDITHPFTIGQQTGRFFPIYWYYFAIQYGLWGAWPLGFYLVNCLVLVATALTLNRITHMISGSALAGLAAGMFYVLAPPVIENYYTLGKTEVQLTLYLGLSVLYLVKAVAQPTRRWLFFVLSIVLLLCSFLTKETALMLIPTSICWTVGYIWMHRGDSSARGDIRLLTSYTAAAIVCAIVIRALAWLSGVANASAGSYSQNYALSAGVILNSLVGQLLLLARDYGALPWLVVVLALTIIYGRQMPGMRRLWWGLGAAIVWATPLLGVLLPWRPSVQEYYLLPASFGICAAAGVGVAMAWRLWGFRRNAARMVLAIYVVLLACALGTAASVIGALISMESNGRVQIIIDRQNNALFDTLARSAPRGGQILFNIQSLNNGYAIHTGSYLRLVKERPDLRIGYLSNATLPKLASGDLVATLYVRNRPVPSVRFIGSMPLLNRWNDALLAVAGPDIESIYSEIQRFPIITIYTHQWLCPLTRWLNRGGALYSAGALCQQTALVSADMMEYGWSVYRARPPASSTAGRSALGVFRSQMGIWQFRIPAGDAVQERTIAFGTLGDIPVVGDWSGRGVKGIGIYRPATHEWLLSDNLDGVAEQSFIWNEMRQGDLPVVGDWDGDGRDTIGFFRPGDASWHLRNSNGDGAFDLPIVHFGQSGDMPLAGDWDGDGIATIGVYRPATGAIVLRNSLDSAERENITYKFAARALPVVTAWHAHAPATVSTFVGGAWRLRYSACQCPFPDPLSPIDIIFGQEGDIPVSGDWGRQ